MEGIKQEFSGQIDDQGVLRMNMVEFKEFTRQHPNQKAVVTVEILTGGDTVMMLSWWENYVLPKAVKAFRETGELMTTDTADLMLRKLTTTCARGNGESRHWVEVKDLDREQLKRFLDEVKVVCAMNLNCIL